MNNNDEEEAIFSKIDKEVKDKAQRYVTESKIAGIETSNSLKKLLELSLTEYMHRHKLE